MRNSTKMKKETVEWVVSAVQELAETQGSAAPDIAKWVRANVVDAHGDFVEASDGALLLALKKAVRQGLLDETPNGRYTLAPDLLSTEATDSEASCLCGPKRRKRRCRPKRRRRCRPKRRRRRCRPKRRKRRCRPKRRRCKRRRRRSCRRRRRRSCSRKRRRRSCSRRRKKTCPVCLQRFLCHMKKGEKLICSHCKKKGLARRGIRRRPVSP